MKFGLIALVGLMSLSMTACVVKVDEPSPAYDTYPMKSYSDYNAAVAEANSAERALVRKDITFVRRGGTFEFDKNFYDMQVELKYGTTEPSFSKLARLRSELDGLTEYERVLSNLMIEFDRRHSLQLQDGTVVMKEGLDGAGKEHALKARLVREMKRDWENGIQGYSSF